MCFQKMTSCCTSDFIHSVYVNGKDAFSTALFRTLQPFFRKKFRYSSLVHLLRRGKPANFIRKALILPKNEFPLCVKVGAINNPLSFSTRCISARAFSGCGTICNALEMIIISNDLSEYGRQNISCTEKYSFAERLLRFASLIISSEESVASICFAVPTIFFAISPVPVASSRTVFPLTTGRIS